jgi:pseudaminic acid cytidylyltransferase
MSDESKSVQRRMAVQNQGGRKKYKVDSDVAIDNAQSAVQKFDELPKMVTPEEVQQAEALIKQAEDQAKIRTICIIPAREGSKRVPGKNFRELGGKEVLKHAEEIAIGSKLFDEVIISSDKSYIAGYDSTWIERSAKNSDDQAGLREVVLEILENEKYKDVENICILYTTGVFTTRDDLRKGLELLGEHNTAFPVKASSIDLKNIIYLKGTQAFSLFPTIDTPKMRQIVASGLYEHVGQWFMMRRAWIESNKIISGNCGYVIVPWERGHDVNTEEDWMIMEAKYKEMSK